MHGINSNLTAGRKILSSLAVKMSSSGQEFQHVLCSLPDGSRLPNNRPTHHSSLCWTRWTQSMISHPYSLHFGVCGRAVEWGTAVKAGRSAVRFPMVSLEFFIDNPFGVYSASNRNEYRRYILVGKGGRWIGLTTLPPLCADVVEILGTSTSCSP